MASSVLLRPLDRVRLAYTSSRLTRFFAWWGGELRSLLPVRGWLEARRPQLSLRLIDGVLEYGPFGAAPARVNLRDEDESLATLARLRERSDATPDLVLTVPLGRALRRRLVLPLAAEPNLRQVVGFEMDRQTPFKSDAVYFDARVIGRDPAARQLACEILVVPRAAIAPDLAALEAARLPLDALDGVAADGQRLGFNLLPPERRAPRPAFWRRLSAVLALLAVVLVFVAMAQSVKNREAAAAALRERVEQVRDEARGAATLRTTLKEAVEGATFLAQKKAQRPAVIDVLLDATRRLPNDTFLQRFSMNGDQVQLQGQSREAAQLIGVLQKSPLLKGPALQGAITPDARTQKEQFLIGATAQSPAAKARPEASPPAARGTRDATAAQP